MRVERVRAMEKFREQAPSVGEAVVLCRIIRIGSPEVGQLSKERFCF